MLLFRFLYLYWIFFYECCDFYLTNFFCRLIYGLPLNNRIDLVKQICYRLECFNIVYVKVFQSLCLEQDILTDIEKDFLIKYTDNVPYNPDEIDYSILDNLENDFGIYVENAMPINSGIVGVVFKGINKKDNDKSVVVKMLKQGIVEKYNEAYSDLEAIVKYIEYIPYLNVINYRKMISDSKHSILSQTDFNKECYNVQYFKDKYKNNNQFVLPEVYSNITDKYPHVIVMTDITGLKYNDIKEYDENIKYEFARLLNKFALLGTLYHGCIQCDLHAGNMFFYLNTDDDAKDSKIPKYQLGIIDFGICNYINFENQNAYFTFFYNIQVKKEYNKIVDVLPTLIENKEYYYNISSSKKEMLFQEVKDCVKNYSNKNFTPKFFINLSRIFKSYRLLYTKEFNHLCISIQITSSISLSLSKKINEIQTNLIEDFVKINTLIEIDD